MQMIAEKLGIMNQFQGVDKLEEAGPDRFRILERIEGGKHQVSECFGLPLMLGWATGSLPEPPNNPQVGMANMRGIMPALAKAKPVKPAGEGLSYVSVSLPSLRRQTRVEKNMSTDDIAKEIVAWIREA